MDRKTPFFTAVVLSVAICFVPFANAVSEEPSAVELAMWEYAVSTGKIEEVDRFLDLYPDSIFTEDARQLKAALADSADQPATDQPAAETEQARSSDAATANAPVPAGPITFEKPLSTDPSDTPRSLRELADGSPLFPPIADLPAEYWEEKNCSNCHAWKQDNLCEQAQFLASKDADAMVRIKHPYGGFFKDALKQWAADGCL